ncbi:MAG: NAD-dependent epimerase/dehydratase family protein [Candidatus Thorarchaeota archaeon]
MNKYLVTGSAGFIGFHLCKRLLEKGHEVVGVDNINDYYDPKLKNNRLQILENHKNFKFWYSNIQDSFTMTHIFNENKFDAVCNLAAQAGVLYSLKDPFTYYTSNIEGFGVMLDLVKTYNIKNFVYASSSSVYGSDSIAPYSEDQPCNSPSSLYAATKKSNELIAKSYNHVFGLNCTGLRFFTVYGPYGRPDMALFIFTKNILNNQPININNYGKMRRSFTYIDDVVDGTISALDKPMGNEIINLGGDESIELMRYIEIIEKNLGMKAQKNLVPMPIGDVESSEADISKAKKLLNYDPKISVEEGIERFINWYNYYYKGK